MKAKPKGSNGIKKQCERDSRPEGIRRNNSLVAHLPDSSRTVINVQRICWIPFLLFSLQVKTGRQLTTILHVASGE